MPGARITIDGLWRCLCPSFDAVTLTRAIGVPNRPRLTSANRSTRTPPCAARRPRLLHATRRCRLQQDGDESANTTTGISAFIDAEKKDQPDNTSQAADQGGDGDATEESTTVEPEPGDPHENAPEPLDVFEGPAPEADYIEAGIWTKDGVNAAEVTSPSDHAAAATAAVGEQPASLQEEAISSTPNSLKEALRTEANDTKTPISKDKRKEDEGEVAYQRALPRMPKRLVSTTVQQILRMNAPFTDFPPNTTEQDVYDAIRCIMFFGDYRWRWLTTVLVKRLLDSGTEPNNFIYSAVLASHALTEGSADTVHDLLNEMRTYKIPWSSTSYHCALRALANHPNYLLRNDVIREMRERWIETTTSGHAYILIGLLRDGQYELALNKLDELSAKGVELQPFVHETFIYVFGKLQFYDDALRIARHQRDRGVKVSVNIWYYLLDVSSKGQNHRVTKYLWNRTVEQGLVNPPDGVLLNILNLAAAYGDTQLAIKVIQHLSARGAKLSRHHYEALAEAYIMHEQVDKAMEVYCIMDAAGVEVVGQTTGQLSQSLSTGDASVVDTAVEAMASLKTKYKVPIGVFNSVLLALVAPRNPTTADSDTEAAETAEKKGAEVALDLYRRIRDYVPSGPDLETYKVLLWRCTDADVAQFLAGEMIALHFRQTPAIREMLFKIHIEHHGPAHRTKRYFYQMARQLMQEYAPGTRKWNVLMDLCTKLVKRLVAERDPEAWHILEICKVYGLDEERIERLRRDIESGDLDVASSSNSSNSESIGRTSAGAPIPEVGESPEDIYWPMETYYPVDGHDEANDQQAADIRSSVRHEYAEDMQFLEQDQVSPNSQSSSAASQASAQNTQ